MRGQFNKTGHFCIRDFHQGIIIVRHIIRISHPLALFHHPDNQIKTAVTYERTDIPRLYHDWRKERKHLFVEKIMHKFLMKRFRPAVLIQINILPVQFLQYFGEDTIIFALLPIYLFCDFGKCLFSFRSAFFGKVLFHDHSPMLGNPDFVKLFEIGRIDRQKLDTLIDRERFILRLQQNAIVKGQPANITFKVFM